MKQVCQLSVILFIIFSTTFFSQQSQAYGHYAPYGRGVSSGYRYIATTPERAGRINIPENPKYPSSRVDLEDSFKVSFPLFVFECVTDVGPNSISYNLLLHTAENPVSENYSLSAMYTTDISYKNHGQDISAPPYSCKNWENITKSIDTSAHIPINGIHQQITYVKEDNLLDNGGNTIQERCQRNTMESYQLTATIEGEVFFFNGYFNKQSDPILKDLPKGELCSVNMWK